MYKTCMMADHVCTLVCIGVWQLVFYKYKKHFWLKIKIIQLDDDLLKCMMSPMKTENCPCGMLRDHILEFFVFYSNKTILSAWYFSWTFFAKLFISSFLTIPLIYRFIHINVQNLIHFIQIKIEVLEKGNEIEGAVNVIRGNRE